MVLVVVVGNLFRLSDGDQHAAGATTLVYCNVFLQVLELELVHRQSLQVHVVHNSRIQGTLRKMIQCPRLLFVKHCNALCTLHIAHGCILSSGEAQCLRAGLTACECWL